MPPPRPRFGTLAWLVVALLTGHAALTLSGVAPSFGWLPVAESLAASVIGLRLLARADAPSEGSGAPVLPARVAAPPADPVDPRGV